ncbi:MAG: SUF system NifU family Fe-S cluster assembly protein [Longimicrobiales bacterium]|nr:SUF system NifU family Fe-S cluster assembly protein [Longimicrobiales bacterium]
MTIPEPRLDSLYQQLILEHYRSPRNRGEVEDPDAQVHLHNPTCGDEILLSLRVRDGRVAEVRFTGQGCSISQAAASMMTQLVTGRPLDEVPALAARFTEMMHGDAEAARDRSMGDLRALAGVSRFPVRVKCALLAFEALQEATRNVENPVPEE